MAQFKSPYYPATIASGQKVTIDVTNSISAGLSANPGLIDHVSEWMKQGGFSRVLDFGAGALRHTLPLLKRGFEVTAVEYGQAYERPKAAEFLEIAKRSSRFNSVVWPHEFLKSRAKYDVVLLTYVLQVVPVKSDRKAILRAVADHLAANGPRRLYYASLFGNTESLPDETKFNDGWVKGRGEKDRTFYAQWNREDTDAFFLKVGYERAGSYKGPSQPFIYEFRPGVL